MGQASTEVIEDVNNSVFLKKITYLQPNLNGENLRIGIAISRFNQPICIGLREACLSELERLGVNLAQVELASVPGALEIPLVLQTMANGNRFDALIALGAVIRGETYHFELVSNEVGSGISRVGLEYKIPIANAVLTVENDEQAKVRIQEKAIDAARVAIEMANLQNSLKPTKPRENTARNGTVIR